MNEFITLDFMATFGGAVFVVELFTEILKKLGVKLDPRVIALIISIIVTMCVQTFFYADLSASAIVLAAFNALLVCAAAIGAFETIVKPIQSKIDGE